MGFRLGRYAVLKHLASGGMADVLLARSDGIEGFERHVVLKRIRPEHARDQRFVRMFLDEARIAATLHHQHIVQVYDVGEASGEYFIAMEYLHGEDVRMLLSAASRSRAHTPLGIAIAIVSAAAAGLHYAHERTSSDMRPLGIVHRDVSPSNILVGYDGAIKVVDFGIVKAATGEVSQAGSIKGKVSYMAPEQCKGTPVDRRGDVYALGIVLYELATTTRLFKGDNTYRVMEQVVHGRFALPHVRRPDLPRELSDIIMRALALDREQRYATADEFRVALEQFAAKAGMTASSSVIAAYMRKQFGERLEPWLNLAEPFSPALDNVPTIIGAATPNTSWTEMPGSALGRITSAIPLPSDPTEILAQDVRVIAAAPRPKRPSIQVSTDAKMGWESQPSAVSRPSHARARIAMVTAPLVLLASVAVWRLTGEASEAAPVVQPTPPPAAAEPPAEPRITREPDVTMPAITLVEPVPAAPRPHPAAPAPRAAEAPARTARLEPPRTPYAPRASRLDPALFATPRSPSPSGGAAPSFGELDRLTSAPVLLPESPSVAAPAAAPAPPPPAAPRAISPSALDGNRLSGDKRIVPDDSTKAMISRDGRDKVSGSYKLCVGLDGNISSVTQLVSTGFPSYDQAIQATIRAQWRYRPFVVNGNPAIVCSAVRFIYTQK